jgi:hypothetical protein
MVGVGGRRCALVPPAAPRTREPVRTYPKSRVVLRVRARESGELFGPYTLHHTP